MDLNEFLFKNRNKITGTELAHKLGVRPNSITNWRYKLVTPSLIHCLMIQEYTGGKVTIYDLLKEEDEKTLEKTLQKLKSNV